MLLCVHGTVLATGASILQLSLFLRGKRAQRGFVVQNSVFVFDCNRVTCACVCECLLLVLFDRCICFPVARVRRSVRRGVFFLSTAGLPRLLFNFAYIARAVCFESDSHNNRRGVLL